MCVERFFIGVGFAGASMWYNFGPGAASYAATDSPRALLHVNCG